MNNCSRFSYVFRVLMVVCLLVWVLAMPAGAVFTPGKGAVATLDPCANKNPVADFSYSIVPSNPLELFLTDKSSCADRWQWEVWNLNPQKLIYRSNIMDASGRNDVVTLPSPGTYTIYQIVGRNCVACTDPLSSLQTCCPDNYAIKYLQPTITAPTTSPPPAPVTTPATQPPQSSPTTLSPTMPETQQTQQQTATVATAQTTVPAAATFVPAPAGQGSGAISITTTPAGAEVWIDNEMKGASPAVISALSPGTHALALRKTGYQNISTTFIIESGQTREYSTGLIPTTKSPGFPALLALGGIFVLFFARKLFR
jgi:hypothetical protein